MYDRGWNGAHRISAATRYSRTKHGFLVALTCDLRKLGISASVRRREAKLTFRADFAGMRSENMLILMRAERQRRLEDQRQFVSRMIARGVHRELADGAALDVDAIRPNLELCDGREQVDIFRFFALMQSIPATRLVFRRLRFLLRDTGHPGSPVMGIIGLSSGVYSLGCRDEIFGWLNPARRDVRERGLRASMQLSICMALPPYDTLRVGRLLAAIAASERVAQEFAQRYGSKRAHAHLRAVVALCGTGLHAPIFNRIMVRPGGLYRRIGATSGYSTLFFSKDTLALAKRVVNSRRGGDLATGRSIRTLKQTLNLCSIPREQIVMLGMPKGVYLAVAGDESASYLCGTSDAGSVKWPAFTDVVSYWRERDLPKAMAIPGTAEAVSRCNAETALCAWNVA